MNWSEFAKENLNQDSWIDGLSLQYKSEENTLDLPPMIKFSLSLAENKSKTDKKRLNIVFPEKKELFFLFTLAKAINDIYNGTVAVSYDPHTFING